MMTAYNLALADGASPVGQEDLKQFALGPFGNAVEDQVCLDGANARIGDETDHVRDRSGDRTELRAGLVERPSSPPLPRRLVLSGLDADFPAPSGSTLRPEQSRAQERGVKVQLPAFLRQEASQ